MNRVNIALQYQRCSYSTHGWCQKNLCRLIHSDRTNNLINTYTIQISQRDQIDPVGTVHEDQLVLCVTGEHTDWGRDHKLNDITTTYTVLVTDDTKLVNAVKRKDSEIEQLKKNISENEIDRIVSKYVGKTIIVSVDYYSKDKFKNEHRNARWNHRAKSWELENVTEKQIRTLVQLETERGAALRAALNHARGSNDEYEVYFGYYPNDSLF